MPDVHNLVASIGIAMIGGGIFVQTNVDLVALKRHLLHFGGGWAANLSHFTIFLFNLQSDL